LLLPCLTWAVIFSVCRILSSLLLNDTIEWEKEAKFILFPLRWPFWFLKELFISYMLVFISMKIVKKEWLAFVLSLLFVLVAPFCEFQRSFLPVFWVGFLLKSKSDLPVFRSKLLLPLLAALFAVCLLFWSGEYNVYDVRFPKLFDIVTQTFNFENIHISVFRLFVGAVGSMFFFLLFERMYKQNRVFKFLERMGVCTLAIYILQEPILEIWLSRLVNFDSVNVWIYNLAITPAVSLVVACICVSTAELINRHKRVSLLLFGSSYQKLQKNELK